MTKTPSPRHPWKALAVVLAMFAVVHGVHASSGWHDHDHSGWHEHDRSSWHDHVIDGVVVESSYARGDDEDDDDDGDCAGIDVRIHDGDVRVHRHGDALEIDDIDDDAQLVDVIDGREWR